MRSADGASEIDLLFPGGAEPAGNLRDQVQPSETLPIIAAGAPGGCRRRRE